MPVALIVEDEPQANQLLAMLVQLRGYRTDSAFTGTEALEIAGRTPPDIVFLDLMLPDINGYEVCRSLKSDKATSAIPIVMVTARLAAENRIESYHAGANDYIPKPYTPDQIFQAMTDAAQWCRGLQGHQFEAVIPIEPNDEEASLRQLSQLGNLLLARSPLDLDAVGAILAALKTVWSDAVAWGRSRHAPGAVATLAYRLQGDGLTLTLRDASGWLGSDRLAPERRWPTTIPTAGFDEVRPVDPDQLVFIKHFPVNGALANP